MRGAVNRQDGPMDAVCGLILATCVCTELMLDSMLMVNCSERSWRIQRRPRYGEQRPVAANTVANDCGLHAAQGVASGRHPSASGLSGSANEHPKQQDERVGTLDVADLPLIHTLYHYI